MDIEKTAQRAFALGCEIGMNSCFMRQPLIQDEQFGEWRGSYKSETDRAIIFKDGSVLAWNTNQPCWYPDGRGLVVTNARDFFDEILTRTES